MLVWSPAWLQSMCRGTHLFEHVLVSYQADLLTALAPIKLLVFVSHRQAALAWSETSAKHFYPEGHAQVDVDEWRKV